MKRILILTTACGAGGDVAARNLREALEYLGAEEARVEAVDLLDSCYGRFEGMWERAFRAVLPRGFRSGEGAYSLLAASLNGTGKSDGLARLRDSVRDILRGHEPDVVVSTCPIYGVLIEEIYRSGRTRDFTLLALVTEPVLEDSGWLRSPADFFVVAQESVGRELAAEGIAEGKIRVMGFPVRPALGGRETRSEPPYRARPRILYLINNARKKAPKLLDRLLERAEWDVTVCVEGDVELEEMARGRALSAPERMTVRVGWRELPELLRDHDVVISRAETGIVQEALAAGYPLMAPKLASRLEEANLALFREANAGVLAEKPREVARWLERIFCDEGRLLALWRKNLEPLRGGDGALQTGRFVLALAATPVALPMTELRALPAPMVERETASKFLGPPLRRLPKRLLVCDLHTHTTWSDGKLTVPELVDFYGQRGFDCLCITDHLCDPMRMLGKLVNLTGLVIPPDEVGDYFEAIEREKKRAWAKYDLMLMTGLEFNKDGYTAKTSTHLLGVDLKEPVNPSLEIKELIAEIHAQGGLAIASHPHETKSHWGKDTLYLWEHVDEYAPLLDAWEVANRDDIFNPVGLKKLPFIASSDFHKPKHIHSWKTVLYCEKEAEAIKHCIRVNRDVSLTLYRDHRFGLEEHRPALPAEGEEEARRAGFAAG